MGSTTNKGYNLFSKATNKELQGIATALAHPTVSDWRTGATNVTALKTAFRDRASEVTLSSGKYTIEYRTFQVSYGTITKAFVSHTRQAAPCGWLNLSDYSS
jgi:hypothetical protein